VNQTFLNQSRFLWLWLCSAAVVVLGAIYWLDHPVGGKNGGTNLGFAYGGISTAGMIFLMYYGMRKRYTYRTGSGTLKSWLGLHVWVGLALCIVVPMHYGFRLEWNLHAVPYPLMVLTVLSGMWGAYAYLRYPPEMTGRREGITVRGSVAQINSLSSELAALAKNKSQAFLAAQAKLDVPVKPTLGTLLFARRLHTFSKQELSDILGTLPQAEYQAGLKMTESASRRIAIANQLIGEASVAALLRVWLFLHLPLSVACFVAMLAHIFWVLFYRWPTR
jgi:hypothetical protein